MVETGNTGANLAEVMLLGCFPHPIECRIVHEHEIQSVSLSGLAALRKRIRLGEQLKATTSRTTYPGFPAGALNEEVYIERNSTVSVGRYGITSDDKELQGRFLIREADELGQFHFTANNSP
jgi:hypothetical protein